MSDEAVPLPEAPGLKISARTTMMRAKTIGVPLLLSAAGVHGIATPLRPADAVKFAQGPIVSGPTFSKPLSTPDGVPEAGQQRAVELMRSGAMFRYTPGVLSETALSEDAICDYTGFDYSVGFNSCGSALFIALKCVGVEPGDHVLANAFSFTAVPSAVHHAGAIPVFVESTDAYVMDMDDLEAKITPQTKVLLLTHMRGKVADMQRVYEIAEKHGITVVEDCAHALGIKWDGVQLGRCARIACFSTQSAKMINSGEVPRTRIERMYVCTQCILRPMHVQAHDLCLGMLHASQGGFLCTNDETAAARAICYAGCYEQLYEQHLRMPSMVCCRLGVGVGIGAGARAVARATPAHALHAGMPALNPQHLRVVSWVPPLPFRSTRLLESSWDRDPRRWIPSSDTFTLTLTLTSILALTFTPTLAPTPTLALAFALALALAHTHTLTLALALALALTLTPTLTLTLTLTPTL